MVRSRLVYRDIILFWSIISQKIASWDSISYSVIFFKMCFRISFWMICFVLTNPLYTKQNRHSLFVYTTIRTTYITWFFIHKIIIGTLFYFSFSIFYESKWEKNYNFFSNVIIYSHKGCFLKSLKRNKNLQDCLSIKKS